MHTEPKDLQELLDAIRETVLTIEENDYTYIERHTLDKEAPLEFLGNGCSRYTFAINEHLVLKVARPGMEYDNAKEWDIALREDKSLITDTLARGPHFTWIIAERATCLNRDELCPRGYPSEKGLNFLKSDEYKKLNDWSDDCHWGNVGYVTRNGQNVLVLLDYAC